MIKVPRNIKPTYLKSNKKAEKKTEKEKKSTNKKKCAVPKVKYSFTCSDLVTAYVTFITNDSISAHLIGRKQSLHLRSIFLRL